MFLNQFPPIHIHPVFILFIFISILTGTFMEISIIFIIVFIHEMGHYFMARVYKWRIRKIMLWVFGGVMETEEHGTRPIKEDLFVTIAGPFQHVIIYVLLIGLMEAGFLNEAVYNTAFTYNTVILLFNLLPIWPLDGGKLLFFLLSMKFPFRKAHNTVIILSIILSIVFIIGHVFLYQFTLSFTCIMLFLFIENRLEWKRRFYVFMRFLLGRYEGNNSIRNLESIYLPGHLTLMEVFSRFKREKKHTIIVKTSTENINRIDEADCLHAYFHEKQYYQPIHDIFKRD